MCGDIHEKAVNRTQSNLHYVECHTQRRYMDVLHWDTTHLILRDSSVDICVTDLVCDTSIYVLVLMECICHVSTHSLSSVVYTSS
jgi:hypothetical protein